MTGFSQTGRVLAIAMVATCLVASTLAFATGRGGMSPVSRHVSRPGGSMKTSTASDYAKGVMVGLAAMGLLVAVRRPNMVMRAAIEKRAPPFQAGSIIKTDTFAGGLVGVTEAESGGPYDPLSLSSRWPEHLPWFREAELKHGRVCMLACVGLLAPEGFRIPFEPFTNPELNAVNAHSKLIGPGLGEGPMWVLLIFCAIVESLRFKQMGLDFSGLTLETAGDLGFGKQFLPKDAAGEKDMRTKELKNGRLAMLGFSGAITTAVLFDSPNFPWIPF